MPGPGGGEGILVFFLRNINILRHVRCAGIRLVNLSWFSQEIIASSKTTIVTRNLILHWKHDFHEIYGTGAISMGIMET